MVVGICDQTMIKLCCAPYKALVVMASTALTLLFTWNLCSGVITPGNLIHAVGSLYSHRGVAVNHTWVAERKVRVDIMYYLLVIICINYCLLYYSI